MANILYYPKINPIRLYQPSPSTLYHSRHIDDFEFFDSIPEWEEQKNYYQPWEKTDLIKLQLQADFGPHNVNVLDTEGNIITTVTFQQIIPNEDNPDLYLYQLDIDLSALESGAYRLQMVSGIDDPLTLESNLIDVCDSHEHTISLDYTNYQYHEGVIWDAPTAYYPSFRVEGAILFKSPASKDFSYEDQTLDESLLNSTPYRLFELIIGDSFGVPDYVIDIVNRILSCSDILIDGKGYTKNEGAKWEAVEQDGIPTRAWKIEMRETVNRSTSIFDANEPVSGRIGIVINADSKGFGLDTGGTTYEITDVQ
jgi:hypothetical protein